MQTKNASKGRELIRVGEAAKLLGISNDTLKRWEKAGLISSVRTPTGHRRFDRDEVLSLLAA